MIGHKLLSQQEIRRGTVISRNKPSPAPVNCSVFCLQTLQVRYFSKHWKIRDVKITLQDKSVKIGEALFKNVIINNDCNGVLVKYFVLS